jgi:hypothetical protein
MSTGFLHSSLYPSLSHHLQPSWHRLHSQHCSCSFTSTSIDTSPSSFTTLFHNHSDLDLFQAGLDTKNCLRSALAFLSLYSNIKTHGQTLLTPSGLR